MTVNSSIALVLAMCLFVASPGPGVMGTVAVAMRQSLKNSVAFIIGMIIGDLVYLTFAVYGLTAIANNFSTVFQMVRIAGGIYLLYLAYKLWTSDGIMERSETGHKKRGSFFAGIFITLSNPKVVIFYCGFLPNFMDLQKLTMTDLAIVCLLVAFVITFVMGTYTYAARKTGSALSRRSGKLLNRSAGTAMAATGVYMISK